MSQKAAVGEFALVGIGGKHPDDAMGICFEARAVTPSPLQAVGVDQVAVFPLVDANRSVHLLAGNEKTSAVAEDVGVGSLVENLDLRDTGLR